LTRRPWSNRLKSFRSPLLPLQPAQKLGFPFGVGADGARGLAEQVNGADGLAEVRQAVRAAVRKVLANDGASLPGQGLEDAEFVILV
jgi:hypothetical protein